MITDEMRARISERVLAMPPMSEESLDRIAALVVERSADTGGTGNGNQGDASDLEAGL